MAKIPEWLSGWELKELWGKNNQTLADYILYYGLPAYDDVTRQLVNIEEELDHMNSFRNEPYGDFEQEAFPILRDRIVECVFKENEVEEFAKKHGLPLPSEQIEKSSQPEPANQKGSLKDYPRLLDKLEFEETASEKKPTQITPAPQSPTLPQYAFFKTKETWKIVFNGEETNLKHEGFKYLHHLIAHKDKEKGFTAIELDNELNPKPKGSDAWIDLETRFEDDESKGELKIKDLSGMVIPQQRFDYNNKAVQKFKNRLIELERDIDEAEKNYALGQTDELKKEKQEIQDYLIKGIELLRDDAKKVSDTVSKAMDRAIKALSGDTYKHFNEAFRPYADTKRYAPIKLIPWVLEKK